MKKEHPPQDLMLLLFETMTPVLQWVCHAKKKQKKHGRNVVCVNASKQPSAEAVFGKAPKVSWKATWAVINWLSYDSYTISSLTRTCSVHSSWIEKNWLLITVIVYRSIAVLTSCLCEKNGDVYICASLLHQPTIGCFPCSVSSMFDQRMDDQNRGMFRHLKVVDKWGAFLFFFLYPFLDLVGFSGDIYQGEIRITTHQYSETAAITIQPYPQKVN